MLGGHCADIVIESIGLPALYAKAFELIRPGSHVAAFGIADAKDTILLALLDMVLTENSIKGSVAGMGEDMHDALTLLMHNRFQTEAFTNAIAPLEEIQSSFETLQYRKNTLKIQLLL